MYNDMTKRFLISLLILPSILLAGNPVYYQKENSWAKTIWSSLNALEQIEIQNSPVSIMPDLGKTDFSIMAWIKTTSEKSCIFSKVAEQAGRPEEQSKALYLENGILNYQIESIGIFSSGMIVNDGQWHHITLTGNDPYEFYIDGKKIKDFQIDKSEKYIHDSPDLRYRIGFGQFGFPHEGWNTFIGNIDEVKLYNKKLLDNEIKAIYQNNENIISGLSGWWEFDSIEEDDEDDDIIIDSSPNKLDGRLFECEISEGKVGNGLFFNGSSGISFSRESSATPSNKIWEILKRDFSSESDIAEINNEFVDGIWNKSFSQNGLSQIASSYASKTRQFSNLKEKAVKLANSSPKSFNDILEIRNIYHLSISSQNMYDDISSSINSLELAINHLINKYGSKYKEKSKSLNSIETFKNDLKKMVENPKDNVFAEELKNRFEEFKYNALVTNNPLINFDKLAFVKRYTYQSSHYYTDFIDGTENPGGNLSILSLKDGTVKDLLPEMGKGIFGRYDLSFDSDKIVFDWKEKLGKGFRIFEIGVNGAGLTQLTLEPIDEPERIKKYDNSHLGGTSRIYYHHTDDMHPCYLPDGGVVFSSTRCEFSVLCDGPTKLTTSVLYRIDGDGSNMKKLTNSAVSEFSPAIMNDGRILYSRWEYVDKGQIAVKCLWAMHPDGSHSQEIYGNDIPYPPVFIHGRPIPGSNSQFVFLGTPHFPQSGVGTVIRIDINKPIRTQEPMTYITPDVDIRTEGGFHHKINGEWIRTDDGPLYMDPFPLSEKFFLVSHNPDKKWNNTKAYGLYLIDEFGNHVKLYQDPEYSVWQPIPLIPRETPPIIPSVRPKQLAQTDEATVILSNVYEGLEGVKKGEVKYLRIMEQVPRPWSSRRMWEYDGGAPAISEGSVLGLKVLHGIVPVYDDGSAYFTVPANKNIYFEAIDSNYMEIQRERTYVNYLPGEKRTCIGCHQLRQLSPPNKYIKALSMEPVRPYAQQGEIAPRSIHYVADVQPVLDRHCISCHNDSENAGDLILTGELTEMFSASYENIMRKGLVETVDEGDDFEDTEPLPPKAIGSHASKFITTILEGHKGIKLSTEDFVKLTTWVDANAQYYGTYYGRQHIKYKDHPDFRPLHTFEEAIGSSPPYEEKLSHKLMNKK